MRRIQNKNLANIVMNTMGRAYQGDANGVFELSDEAAAHVLSTPGWTALDPAPGQLPTRAEYMASGLDPATFDARMAQYRQELLARGITPIESEDSAPREELGTRVRKPDLSLLSEDERQALSGREVSTQPLTPPVAPEGATDPAAGDQEPPSSPKNDEPEDERPEGPDLTKLTSKKALFAVAVKYGVTLSDEQRALSVDELRAVLDKALYGTE